VPKPVILSSNVIQRQEVPIGLALGGGAARGFAHILMIEAFDELGIRPQILAGTSMGSIIGAGYAGGLSGKEMRQFTVELFERRTQVFRRIINRWPGSIGDLMNPMTPALVNPETLIDIMMPDDVPRTFEELDIPFAVVTTDFNTQQQVVFESGPLIPAVAGSSTIPAIMKPVQHDGRVLIDGGFVNPTPYDVIMDRVPYTIAIDVTGIPGTPEKGVPGSLECIVGSTLIMLRSILREKLKNRRPDLLIEPDVTGYRAMQFFKCEEILAASEPAKEELKRALEMRLKDAA